MPGCSVVSVFSRGEQMLADSVRRPLGRLFLSRFALRDVGGQLTLTGVQRV